MKSLAFAGFLITLSLSTTGSWAQSNSDKAAVAEVFSDGNIELRPHYEFDKSVKMELVNANKDASTKSKLVYIMRYSESNSSISMKPIEIDGAIPVPEAEVIVDFEAQKMFTFMNSNGTKMAMVHEIAEDDYFGENNVPDGEISIEKSGKEKTLFGYQCYEYTVNSSECVGSLWAAADLNINDSKSFEALGLEIGDYGKSNDLQGFVVSFELTYPSGEITTMNVLDINLKDSYQLKTAGYVPTAMKPVVDSEK